MWNMRTQAGPVIGDRAEIIQEWPQGPEAGRWSRRDYEEGFSRESTGRGLPLRNLTTHKEEEGEIGIPQSIYRIWNFTLEGNHGETSTLSFVATGR